MLLNFLRALFFFIAVHIKLRTPTVMMQAATMMSAVETGKGSSSSGGGSEKKKCYTR